MRSSVTTLCPRFAVIGLANLGGTGSSSDLVLALDIFGGPLYFRGVILGEHFPPDDAQRLTEAALGGLDATTSPRR